MPAMPTILHPTDFSEHSEQAFRLACSRAGARPTRLVVLHVAPPPVYGLIGAQADEYARSWKVLQQIQAPDPAICLEHLLHWGDPVHEIVRAAQELDCRLIIMGTHGRTGLSRWVMGSVAEGVARSAPCAVLTVSQPFEVLERIMNPVSRPSRQPLETAHPC